MYPQTPVRRRLLSVALACGLLAALPSAAQQDVGVENNLVTLKAQNSSKCLDIKDASTRDHARLIQYTCNGQANQQFETIPVGIGYYSQLKARHSGKCLNVKGGSKANGAFLEQITCDSTARSQQFRLDYISTAVNRILINAPNTDTKCVTVKDASTADLARIVQFSCNGQANQTFDTEYFPDVSTGNR